MTLTNDQVIRWLAEQDSQQLAELWDLADHVRRQHVGDAIHLRGLVEISSHCHRTCLYCGLRLQNRELPRYRMTADDIVCVAHEAARRKYGTVVLQAGEDPQLSVEMLCDVIRRIKSETPLAVTLSLGERPETHLRQFRSAGADRYLLRFETSNLDLLAHIHPPLNGQPASHRLDLLHFLKSIGFEVGSGAMVGIPGQSFSDLSRDICLFHELDLDMIGVGPYVPHPDTPLYHLSCQHQDLETQVPANEIMTYKTVALARLMCPRANIPSTTALATINPAEGQLLALQRGANVIMPNLTPVRFRQDYQIYPNKAGSQRTPDQSAALAAAHVSAIGRHIAQGHGDSPNVIARRSSIYQENRE